MSVSTLTVEVPTARLDQLRALAERLHVSVEELVAATIEDLLAQPDEQFEKEIEHVLSKSSVLYHRLSRY